MPFSRSLLLLFCLWLAVPPATEAARAQFMAEAVQGDDWSASGVVATVVVDKHHRPGLELRAAQAVLPAGVGAVKGLHLHCPRLMTPPGHWRCQQAVLRAQFPVVGEQTLTVDFDYEPREARLKLTATGLKVAAGSIALSATATGAEWQASLALQHLDLAQAQALSSPRVAWPDGTWAGSLSAQLQAAGAGSERRQRHLQPAPTRLFQRRRPDRDRGSWGHGRPAMDTGQCCAQGKHAADVGIPLFG